VTPAEQAFAEQLEHAVGSPRPNRRPGGEPAFVRALREAGRETFLRVMLPTQKHEDWRFTNLSALSASCLGEVAPLAGGDPQPALPAPPRLVFWNGYLDLRRTDLSGLPRGVRVVSLGAALRERPGAVEPLLGQVVGARDHAFGALNAGLFRDGAFIEFAGGVACERPIHLVFVTSAVEPAAWHPRNLIALGQGARGTVVESYHGQGPYLVNAVTEVALGEGARLEHDRIQEEDQGAFHVGQVEVAQSAASRFTAQSVALGAALARVEVRALLGGEGAACDVHGLYVGVGRQVLDHLVRVDHASPRCTSREVFKGILDGTSRGVFAGRVHVRPGAQKTDASQVSSNLLLSREAVADSRPELEILADDVKCSHGGTVGQLREEQLFYLRSRGVPEALARALLTWAFASEMVERVGPGDVRSRVREAVRARLPGGALLLEAA
jgi:Fe-S cluster assembly protein SufD